MIKTRVRKGRLRDIPAMARAEESERDPYGRDELRAILTDDEYVVLVATQRSRYLGHVIAAEDEDELTITGLCYPEVAIGDRLVRAMTSYARKRVDVVRALPLDTDITKHLLYQSLGFRAVGLADYGLFCEYHFAKHLTDPNYFVGTWDGNLAVVDS